MPRLDVGADHATSGVGHRHSRIPKREQSTQEGVDQFGVVFGGIASQPTAERYVPSYASSQIIRIELRMAGVLGCVAGEVIKNGLPTPDVADFAPDCR